VTTRRPRAALRARGPGTPRIEGDLDAGNGVERQERHAFKGEDGIAVDDDAPRLGRTEVDGEAAGSGLLDDDHTRRNHPAIERDREHPLDPALLLEQRRQDGVAAEGDPGGRLQRLQLLDELELDHPGRTGGGHQRRLPRQACRGG
jgi:hypothetical protein